MKQEEYLLNLQMLEEQANQFEEQLKLIDQQISELNKLKEDLAAFEKSNEKEMFAEFGKGIFVKATVDKKEFLVDVGEKIFVKKSSKEISEIINQQIKKFESIKPEISKRVETINLHLDHLVNQAKEENAAEEKAAVKPKSDKVIIKNKGR